MTHKYNLIKFLFTHVRLKSIKGVLNSFANPYRITLLKSFTALFSAAKKITAIDVMIQKRKIYFNGMRRLIF